MQRPQPLLSCSIAPAAPLLQDHVPSLLSVTRQGARGTNRPRRAKATLATFLLCSRAGSTASAQAPSVLCFAKGASLS